MISTPDIKSDITVEAYACGVWCYENLEPCPYPRVGGDGWARGARAAWLEGYKHAMKLNQENEKCLAKL